MSRLENFAKACETLIRKGEPFLAYYFPKGYGFLYLKDAGARRVRSFRKMLDKMRADGRLWPLYIVESDGEHHAATCVGGEPDALRALSLPGDSDPVGAQ